MDWGKIAGDVLGSVGSALGIGVLDKNLGSKSRPAYSQGEVLQQIQMGNALDLQNQKDMFDYRISYGKALGMTNYEMMMGPAAGAGGGTTGSGQTLGNSASAVNQAKMQADTATRENRANRAAGIIQTAMQTDAQKYAADRAAGATIGSAEISAGVQQARNVIEQGKLDLASREFEQATLPAAQENLRLTEQQVKKATNDVATSTPEFLRAMKILTMSAENLIATIMVNGQPVDVTDPKQLSKLSVSERAKLLTAMIGASSHTYRESTGIQAKGSEVLDVWLDQLSKKPVQYESGAKGYPVLGDSVDDMTDGQRDVLKSMSGLGTMDQTYGR